VFVAVIAALTAQPQAYHAPKREFTLLVGEGRLENSNVGLSFAKIHFSASNLVVEVEYDFMKALLLPRIRKFFKDKLIIILPKITALLVYN
jgi:hypothetical protein